MIAISTGDRLIAREDETRMNQRRVLTVKTFDMDKAVVESHNEKLGTKRRISISLDRLCSSAYRKLGPTE